MRCLKYLFATLSFMVLVTGEAWAGESEYTLSSHFRQAFAIVRQQIDQDRADEAMARLDTLSRRSLNPYEKALVEQTRGFLLAQRDDYAAAIKAFEQALKRGALPKSAVLGLHYNLGQLYMAEERFQLAAEHLDSWLKMTDESEAAVYSWLGYAYYQLKEYAKAEHIIKTALQRFSPLREWYQILSAIYIESGRYQESADLLNKGVASFPEDKFLWRQWASSLLYSQQEMEALTILMLAWQQGVLDAPDVPLIAQLFRRISAPYYGAKLIRESLGDRKLAPGLKTYRLLAECLSQAREAEAAADAYAQAARFSNDGEMDLRRAELLIGLERWAAAEKSLRKALDSGIAHPGQAYYLLGIALHEEGKNTAALASFMKALEDESVTRFSKQWIKRLESASN